MSLESSELLLDYALVTPLIFKPWQRLDFEPNLKPEPILALKIQDANLKFASGKRSVKVLPGNHIIPK